MTRTVAWRRATEASRESHASTTRPALSCCSSICIAIPVIAASESGRPALSSLFCTCSETTDVFTISSTTGTGPSIPMVRRHMPEPLSGRREPSALSRRRTWSFATRASRPPWLAGSRSRHNTPRLPTFAPFKCSLRSTSCESAYARWRDHARAWFDGRNAASQPVYDRENGRVCDGIDDGRLNPHSGAEANVVGAQALLPDVATRVGTLLDAVADRLEVAAA